MTEAKMMRVTRLDEDGQPVGEPFVTTGWVTEEPTPVDWKPCVPIPCPEPVQYTISGSFVAGRRGFRRMLRSIFGVSYGELRRRERHNRGRGRPTKRVHGARRL